MRYAIWNNKGGVGKSFLTFVLSCEYARQNPDKSVYVVDMCPQANVSEVILGGNGKGAEVLAQLTAGGKERKSIGGYFDKRLESPHALSGSETSLSIQSNTYNESMPDNLFLICGDPSLEVQAEAINQIAGQTLPQGTWKNVHSWLSDLCGAIERTQDSATFFIDCNPSFAAYTKLSIVAAHKLIIPCTADGSSARAIKNVGQLVYGHGVPQQYENAIFAKRAIREGLNIPTIHMVLLNRSTQYNNKASKAFGAMFDAIREQVTLLLQAEPRSRGTNTSDVFKDIPDTHSVAIVASHHGLPVGDISVGSYDVHDENPQVNKEPLDRYYKAIAEVAAAL